MSNNEFTLAKEYNQQAMILYSKDNYEEAKVYLNKAIEEDPQLLDSYVNMAQVNIMEDDYEGAKKQLNKVILLDKKCAIAYFHLGNVELLQNNTEAAKEHYTKAISLGYDNTQIYINLAADAQENGDFEGAISYYNKIIALDKFNAYAKARKIEIYVALNRMPEALKACDSMLETNPDVFEGYHYKYAILSDLGRLAEAEEILDRAITLFPDDEAFFYDKARLLHAQGKSDEALAILDEKVKGDESNRSDLVAFKAQLLLSLERTAEAREILTAEYALSEDSEVAYLLLSIYMAEKEYENAVVCADKVLESGGYDNYYYAALYYRAIALKKQGKEAEAREALEGALKVFRAASSRTPGQLQLYFYRSICHKELGQYDKALELIEFVLNVDDGIAEAHLVKSEIYKETGRTAEAEGEYATAVALKPEIKEMMEV